MNRRTLLKRLPGGRRTTAFLATIAVLVATTAEARCGKISDVTSGGLRSDCNASSGDLLLKFEDFGGAPANNDPLDDEYGAAFYTIQAGDTAAFAEASDPQILPADVARLNGRALEFKTGDYLRIDDISANQQLRSKFEVYVTFWIRARETIPGNTMAAVADQTILVKRTTATTCGLGTLCENYHVWLRDTATAGKYGLAFQIMRNNAAFDLQACHTDLHVVPAVPLFDYGKWYHVTLGGFYSGNTDNLGVAASDGFGRAVVDGVPSESAVNTCLTTAGGGPGSKEFVSDPGVAMPIFIGGPGGTAVDFDLDDLRIDAWDQIEVLADNPVGAPFECEAPKPGCATCSATAGQTGCPRSRLALSGSGTIGRGSDVLNGIAVTQVMFAPPATEWQSVTLYRKFESGGGALNLAGYQICDSASADDDGLAACYTLPSSPAPLIGPGQFLQVLLCASGSTGCNADDNTSPEPGVPTCQLFYTRALAGQLGAGATLKSPTCTAGTCLNGWDPFFNETLDADLAVLRTGAGLEKSGAAWKELGQATVAASSTFNNQVALFGVWPTDFSGGALQGHLAFELSDNTDPDGVMTVQGLKLKTAGSNGNPKTDGPIAGRDWVEILAGGAHVNCENVDDPAVTGSSQYVLEFGGQGVRGGAVLHWLSGDESQTSEYRLFRSADPDGPYAQIAALPSQHSLAGGVEYEYADAGLEDGAAYWYGLEVVDDDGAVASSWPGLQVVAGEAPGNSPGCRAAAGASTTSGGALAALAALAACSALRIRRADRRAKRSGVC